MSTLLGIISHFSIKFHLLCLENFITKTYKNKDKMMQYGNIKDYDYCVCAKHKTVCNGLCSSSFCDSASLIRNIRGFGAKTYFTHQ